MTSQIATRLLAFALPLLLLVGCDTAGDPMAEPEPHQTTANFNATAYWSAYDEDIKAVGAQQFYVRSIRNGGGSYDLQIRSGALQASFSGTSSGRVYELDYDGPNLDWIVLNGPIGSQHLLNETIRLREDESGVEAEGLVVTEAKILSNNTVSFVVKDVISLP